MGNARSNYDKNEPSEFDDIWWTNGSQTKKKTDPSENNPRDLIYNYAHLDKNTNNTFENSESDQSISSSTQDRSEKFKEFKMELAAKHEKRRQLIAEKRKEMEDIRNELMRLKKENEELRHNVKKPNSDVNIEDSNSELERLREENETLKALVTGFRKELIAKDEICETNRELKENIVQMQAELQNLNSEVVNFEKEKKDYEAHVVALKEVIKVSKQMLLIREAQLSELRQKVDEIEKSLAGRDMNVLSQDLREEYERQLQNIRNLRNLYEERQRADKVEKARLNSVLDTVKYELEQQKKHNTDNEARIEALEKENSDKYDEIKNLESNLGLSKAECRQYHAELAAINQLFSQILISFNNSQEIDLEKLVKLLEENHNLLQNIAVNEESNSVSSALPKVLLDLINRINDENMNPTFSKEKQDNEKIAEGTANKLETIIEESESQTSSLHQLNSPEEIVENLPKVWRVLIELLSHQCPPVNIITEESENDGNPCYKLVETPKGPNLVLSVSQTFIRLKDLILEKKSLEKELSHLKHLNTHLETRLSDQGKRLETVSNELSKTWLVVGKLQKQHQVLHTQEQILRYELAQKRKLLNTLKEELEHSREKWLEARAKNFKTEKQWKQLRTEFASRKTNVKDNYNNSVESGYSDERECSSSEDEPGYETDVSEFNLKGSAAEDTNDTELSDGKDSEENETDLSEKVTCIESTALDCTKTAKASCSNADDESTNVPDDGCEKVQNEVTDNLVDNISQEKLDKTDLVQNDDNEEIDCRETETGKTSCQEDPLSNMHQEDDCIGVSEEKQELLSEAINVSDQSNTTEPYKAVFSLEESCQEEASSSQQEDCSSVTEEKQESLSETLEVSDQINTREPKKAVLLLEESRQEEASNITCQQENCSIVKEKKLESLSQALEVSDQSNTSENQKAVLSLKENCQEDASNSTRQQDCSGVDEEKLERLEVQNPICTAKPQKPVLSLEERLAAREERLSKMEGQCQQLVSQVTNTSQKSISICNKLDSLHGVYGENSQSEPGTETSCSQDFNEPSSNVNQE